MVSTPKKEQYRTPLDPYNGMEEPDIRPSNILKELSDGEKNASKPIQNDGEKPKTKNRKTHESSSDILRRRERNQSNETFSSQGQQSFRNSVRGKNRTIGKGGRTRGLFKKVAPLSAITTVLFGGGFFFYAAQSMLAPHISALYTQATDLQFTSYSPRNARIMAYMLDGGDQVEIGSLFARRYKYFPSYLQDRLAKNGIEIGHINADNQFEPGQAPLGYKTVLKYGDKTISADKFQDEFASNASFREAYYNAKRGRVAGFFDDSSEAYYKKKGATRDIFDNYKSTGDKNADMDEFQSTVSSRVTGSDGSINTIRTGTDEETGEEIKQKNGEDIDINNIDGATPESKAHAMVNSIAGKVSSVGVPVCSALRIANLINVAVSAYQIQQSIAYFLSFMEPISKMMAGEGEASGINEALNLMTQQTTSEVQYVGDDGEPITQAYTGSMLESSGAKIIMGNTLSSDSEIQPFSFDNIRKAATRIVLVNGGTNVVCSGIMAASAIVSLASTAIPGGALATFVVGAIARTIGGIALTGIIAGIINAIVPYAAKMFAINVFESYTGIPAGNLFSQGAAAANFSLATQGSAYMPSSEESIKTQNRQITRVIAQEAEIDRLRRSPLDTSSPNTFLGSIMSKFSYLSYSNSLINIMASVTRVASSATKSLIPTAAALDDDLKYTSQYSECANLSGTMCDMYGYPIVSADYSTVDMSPDDPSYLAAIEPNLNENGDIKDNSELAKFINFCVNRESPWGVTDANILNALQTDGGIVVNNLPFVNDIIDVVNAAEDVYNQGWATGKNCINSSDNPRWDSEFKYYQRYVEDMRILYDIQGQEDNETNPVLTYQEQYEKAHPVDNSFKGTLSRISGLSTDDVAFLLEYIDYSNELAQYDPSTRDSFGDYIKPEVKLSFTKTPISSNYYLSVITEPLFVDRRNYTI